MGVDYVDIFYRTGFDQPRRWKRPLRALAHLHRQGKALYYRYLQLFARAHPQGGGNTR